eukprot:scaffold116081_cov30-Tisochrysis_lutea.AAC.2
MSAHRRCRNELCLCISFSTIAGTGMRAPRFQKTNDAAIASGIHAGTNGSHLHTGFRRSEAQRSKAACLILAAVGMGVFRVKQGAHTLK